MSSTFTNLVKSQFLPIKFDRVSHFLLEMLSSLDFQNNTLLVFFLIQTTHLSFFLNCLSLPDLYILESPTGQSWSSLSTVIPQMNFPAPIAPFKDHIYNDVFQMYSSNPEPPPKFQIHIMNCNLNSHIRCLTGILNLIATSFYFYLKTHSLPQFPILVNSNILHPLAQQNILEASLSLLDFSQPDNWSE